MPRLTALADLRALAEQAEEIRAELLDGEFYGLANDRIEALLAAHTALVEVAEAAQVLCADTYGRGVGVCVRRGNYTALVAALAGLGITAEEPA